MGLWQKITILFLYKTIRPSVDLINYILLHLSQYRCLNCCLLIHRFNYGLFGLNPVWFHLTNILMHAVVCVLFTETCISVAGLHKVFGVIAGIVFAIHPIHTEAVSSLHITFYFYIEYL